MDLPGGAEVLCAVHDITDRKAAEQRLAESEQRYRAIVENSADLVWTVTREGRVSYASPSWLRVTGYRPEVVVGRQIRAGLHPGDVAAAERTLQRLLDGHEM